MNATDQYRDLFYALDAAGVFESYLDEAELDEFDRGTGGNPRLVNLLAAAETRAYEANCPDEGIKLGRMARLVADNLDGDFSA